MNQSEFLYKIIVCALLWEYYTLISYLRLYQHNVIPLKFDQQ